MTTWQHSAPSNQTNPTHQHNSQVEDSPSDLPELRAEETLESQVEYPREVVEEVEEVEEEEEEEKEEEEGDDEDEDEGEGEGEEEVWSEQEHRVRWALAQISQVPIERIRRSSTIYEIGLDSISASQVVALLKRSGLASISVIDLLEVCPPPERSYMSSG